MKNRELRFKSEKDVSQLGGVAARALSRLSLCLIKRTFRDTSDNMDLTGGPVVLVGVGELDMGAR